MTQKKPLFGDFFYRKLVNAETQVKDDKNIEKDYEHFASPLLLNAERAYKKIRNLIYRYIPDGSLFPTEIDKYDPYVIREALHNCIAHQDYELKGRINLVEKPDEIILSNMGNFIPGTIESVIEKDSPPEYYRNPFLANAMVNLNMIDTIGGGIKKMFHIQMDRFFPLPEYDLCDHQKVIVKILGKVIDVNYTRILSAKSDLTLKTIILLDRVQKKGGISKEDFRNLKSLGLLEGRYPNIFISLGIASLTEKKADYVKYRAFDDDHYKKMILAYLNKYDFATRKDIDKLLFDKLSDILDEKRKTKKISNLVCQMSLKDKTIVNIGNKKNPKWIINK